jgi:hypothetical protein
MSTLAGIKNRIREYWSVWRRAEAIYALLARIHREQAFEKELASDTRVLAPYGYVAYSMADQDGILQEIFKRIGATNRQLVEFGCGDGLENNTVYLVMLGWKAFWMDGGGAQTASVREKHASRIASGQLQVRQTFITRENINELIGSSGLGPEIDLLVIDLDGNDYYIWEALTAVNPRVVVIEYNATFRPPHKVVQEYKADHVWDSTNYFGSSLAALEEMGRKKGYCLVGCNYTGIDAFFVRQDLVGEHFAGPFTAERHYRPAMYDAYVRGFSFHRRNVGPYRVL